MRKPCLPARRQTPTPLPAKITITSAGITVIHLVTSRVVNVRVKLPLNGKLHGEYVIGDTCLAMMYMYIRVTVIVLHGYITDVNRPLQQLRMRSRKSLETPPKAHAASVVSSIVSLDVQTTRGTRGSFLIRTRRCRCDKKGSSFAH
jgi:hypothetical protein